MDNGWMGRWMEGGRWMMDRWMMDTWMMEEGRMDG